MDVPYLMQAKALMKALEIERIAAWKRLLGVPETSWAQSLSTWFATWEAVTFAIAVGLALARFYVAALLFAALSYLGMFLFALLGLVNMIQSLPAMRKLITRRVTADLAFSEIEQFYSQRLGCLPAYALQTLYDRKAGFALAARRFNIACLASPIKAGLIIKWFGFNVLAIASTVVHTSNYLVCFLCMYASAVLITSMITKRIDRDVAVLKQAISIAQAGSQSGAALRLVSSTLALSQP